MPKRSSCSKLIKLREISAVSFIRSFHHCVKIQCIFKYRGKRRGQTVGRVLFAIGGNKSQLKFRRK